MILIVGSISALEMDNRKGDLIIDETTSKYGRIEIRDWFGLIKLIELELKTNTDKCLIECSAEKEIIMYQKGSLIDEIRFETINPDGSRTIEPIEDYKFYIKKNNKWITYELGTLVNEGTYQIRLEGKKSILKSVDWVIKSNGQWIDEWAVWDTNQPRAYFSFDETTGNIVENKINVSNNGNRTGMLDSDWVPGQLDNGLQFNGSAIQFVNVSNGTNLQMNPDFIAISLWVNFSDVNPPGNNAIYRKGSLGAGSQYTMYMTGEVISAHVDGTNLASTKLVKNRWYHIVRIYNTTGQFLYVDGELNASSGTTTGVINPNIANLYFGYDGGAFAPFNGTVDEFGMWENLTTGEIAELFNSGAGDPFRLPSNISVSLVSPIDNFQLIGNEVDFNCSAITILGNTLVNMSLWHNGTGPLIINQTKVATGISNATNFTTTITQSTLTSWTCSACDSNGDCNFALENRTIERIDFIIINETFSANTIEGSSEDFVLNVTVRSGLTITESSFIYNGSSSNAEIISINENATISRTGFIIPNVEIQTTNSFNWILNFSDSSSANTSSQNQIVNNISIGDCSSFSNNIINLSLVDEKTQTSLTDNITIETAFNIFSIDRTINIANFSGNFSENNISICLNRNLLGNTNYTLDSIIRYEAQDHVNEYYNIVNFSLTNISTFQNITLFDLLSADSTEFRLSFTGTDFLPAEGVLVFVERQYIPENTFKTVELPITDTNGQTILHLVANEVIYNLIFIKDGILLRNFRNLRAFCDDPTISDCTISLNALSDESGLVIYDDQLGIAFPSPPTYNSSTNRISFAYTSIDGSVKDVIMRVERRDVFGNNSICDNSLNSISGVLSCNIGSGITDTTLVTTISIDGNDKIVSEVVIDNSAYGNIGYVMWFFLTLGLVLEFSKDKNGVLIGLLIGFLATAGLGLITGGIIGVGSAGIWIIIITLIGLWRLNKNKID